MIPAGLRPGETEFMELDSEIIAIHEGNKKHIEQLPYQLLAMIDLAIDHKQRLALTGMKVFDYLAQIKQFLKCNASGADCTPDLKDGAFNNEYVRCAFRGKCAYEGKLCKVVKCNSGEYLTFSEMRITSHIREGLFDKEIAAACGISVNTVKVHKQNIQNKLQVERKTQIATKAIELGIN